jgi:hypothetical protein
LICDFLFENKFFSFFCFYTTLTTFVCSIVAQQIYPNVQPVIGDFPGSLNNQGEVLQLADASGM